MSMIFAALRDIYEQSNIHVRALMLIGGVGSLFIVCVAAIYLSIYLFGLAGVLVVLLVILAYWVAYITTQ